MNREEFAEKYLDNEEDVYMTSLSRLPMDLWQEYVEMKMLQRESLNKLSEIVKNLDGETASPAYALLLHYEEASNRCACINADAMFFYGAELMEKEC